MKLPNVIDFLIIAFVIFVALRLLVKLKKEEKQEQAAAEPVLTKDQELLAEIRDLLKK